MSIKENLELYCELDIEKYLRILDEESNVQPHPNQINSYLVDGLPFYRPRQTGDHISVLGFNKIPLSFSLIQALIDHPELVPNSTVVCWTQEQDLILKDTIGNLRRESQKRVT